MKTKIARSVQPTPCSTAARSSRGTRRTGGRRRRGLRCGGRGSWVLHPTTQMLLLVCQHVSTARSCSFHTRMAIAANVFDRARGGCCRRTRRRAAPAAARTSRDEIIAAIRVEVPAYARPLEGPFGRGLASASRRRCASSSTGSRPGGAMPRSRVYVDLGRGEVRAGRSLDVLLAAYRVGARVAWRRFSAGGVAAGLEPQTLYLLAESIFAYIDELSAESAEGYALEQSAAAGERRAQRQRLARLLLREPPADPRDVERGRARGAVAAAGGAGGARRPRARERADRAAPAGRRDRRHGRRPSSARCCRTPSDPGCARSSSMPSGSRHVAALGPTVRVGRRAAQPRARSRRAGARGRGRGARRRRARRGRPHDRAAAAAATGALAQRAGARAARAARGARRGPARAADGDARRLARRPGAAAGGGRASSTSIRRRCATASRSCASCSATRSRTRSARFELELALRAEGAL